MRYTTYGKTGLSISRLTSGGMRYQQAWRDMSFAEISPENQKNLSAILHQAYDLGINHFETARGYGTSEMQMGQVLGDFTRDNIIVQTKGAPKKQLSEFKARFEESLGHLKLDYINLFTLHGLNTPEVVDLAVHSGAIEQLYSWKREGRIGHIGFSSHGLPDSILYAQNAFDFDYCNIHYYWSHQHTASAAQNAHERKMGLMLISPNDKGGHFWNPSLKLREICAPLTPMQFHTLWCLSQPEVDTISIGAKKPEDFMEHTAALERLDEADKLLPPILKRLDQAMIDALGMDWWENWDRCIPPYHALPGEVNVHEILRAYNMAKGLGQVSFAVNRYKMLGTGHWFPGEKAAGYDEEQMKNALFACPLQSQILPVLKEAHQWFNEFDPNAGPRNTDAA